MPSGREIGAGVSGDFRQLAEERALDAAALLAADRFSGAYYLAGYATECALKAVALKDLRPYVMPDRDFATNLHVHSIDRLIERAQLREELTKRQRVGGRFSGAWALVRSWTETSRYELWSRAEAEDMITATLDPEEGVFPWVKTLW